MAAFQWYCKTYASQVIFHRSLLGLEVAYMSSTLLFLVVILIIQRLRDRYALTLKYLNGMIFCVYSVFLPRTGFLATAHLSSLLILVITAILNPLEKVN